MSTPLITASTMTTRTVIAPLHALAYPATRHTAPHGPWLVWLHGFLGNHREWQSLVQALPFARHLLIDLPGHGESARLADIENTTDDHSAGHKEADNPDTNSAFRQISQQLNATLAAWQITDYWLIGYSLGGRLALYHACHGSPPGLRGLIVEGAHPGLTCHAERQTRYQSDCHWAHRFRQQPLPQVLDDWYQQPVFATLTPTQRATLVALRAQNDGVALAALLQATSLAKQPDLRPALATLSLPFHYLCGERDDKFRALAQNLRAPCWLISNAGHNAHRDNPGHMAQQLTSILRHSFSSSTHFKE